MIWLAQAHAGQCEGPAVKPSHSAPGWAPSTPTPSKSAMGSGRADEVWGKVQGWNCNPMHTAELPPHPVNVVLELWANGITCKFVLGWLMVLLRTKLKSCWEDGRAAYPTLRSQIWHGYWVAFALLYVRSCTIVPLL